RLGPTDRDRCRHDDGRRPDRIPDAVGRGCDEGLRASRRHGRAAADPGRCERAVEDLGFIRPTRLSRTEATHARRFWVRVLHRRAYAWPSSDREGHVASERTIETLFDERRTFPPPPEFARHANANDPQIYAR